MSYEILEGLTEQQKQAVTYNDGPLLVVAGAGSGKTRVITRRVAWLVANGVRPSSILGITFTNKAAREMKERVSRWVADSRIWVHTFHSACARILRREINLLPPYTNDFTIYDETDRVSVLRSVCNELNIDMNRYKPSIFGGIISAYKNSLSDISSLHSIEELPPKILLPFFEKYTEMLKTCNALDFDDLLYLTHQLFRDEPYVLEKYRRRFEHVLVDEYQDTNHLQYSLLKQLCAPDRNICATGDPDQAIYGWRGADISNILNFEKDFASSHRVTLEQNFRSTNAILKTANKLIQNNEQRFHKDLFSELGEGEKPSLLMTSGDTDEAGKIIDKIRGLVVAEGYDYSDFSVFYRTNAQSRAFEAACRAYDIPYTIVGAVEFYRRKVVKDLVAYLKVLINPNDEVSLLRIINTPARGVGLKTVGMLKDRARETNRSFLEVIHDQREWGLFGKRGSIALEGFHSLMKKLEEFPRKPVAPLLEYVIESVQYLNMFKNTKSAEDVDAIENVKALVADAALFDSEKGEGLREYLERLALISDVDNLDEGQGSVTLMTIHAAKGLEFPCVFLSGAEEGLLPHERSKDSVDKIEEERRLFYVAVTRAKRFLTVSLCRTRMINGRFCETIPSRFLEESGLRARSSFSSTRVFTQKQEKPRPNILDLEGLKKRIAGLKSEKKPQTQKENNPDTEEAVKFVRGDLVNHPQFGKGKIEEITGVGSSKRIRIYFRYYGVKAFRYDIAVKMLTPAD